SALLSITLFWGINGFFQAMGWTPMVRVMAHWFPIATRGKTMGLLGTCYQLGAAFASMLAIFLTGYYCSVMGGDWRSVFLVPSAMFAAVGLLYFILIRNQPEDVGLPPIDGQQPAGEKRPDDDKNPRRSNDDHGSQSSILANVSKTLSNPYLWIVAWAFFALDVNRYGFVNWLPAFLSEQATGEASSLMGNFKLVMKLCIHPLAGSLGAITAGWATDRFFGGRRAPVIVILMIALGVFSITFPYIDPHQTWLVVLVVAIVGFCTYGPHILMVAHAAQDFGKKTGAAGAAGFIDAMGYVGASLAGWGAGVLIGRHGYHFTFATFGIVAFAGALMAALLWKVGPKAGGSS
ncbi:MAG: MFS transporter, partial [Pirellulales bacterium]|nr:MFS transporter [Pirellulales bacterium]